MAFNHGVNVNYIQRTARNAVRPDTATIALVGLAPKGPTNELVTIRSLRQGLEVFGQQIAGSTIPYALAAIFGESGAEVIVNNIFDPVLHGEAVQDEALSVASGQAATGSDPYNAVTLTSSDGNTTYTEGTDYSIDAYGRIRVLDGTVIADGDTILASYGRIDRDAVTNEQVIGSLTGARTGLHLLDAAPASLGLVPKVILVPELGEVQSVIDVMAAKAEQFGAVYLVDAPNGTTVAQVVQGRGPLGGVPGFRTTDKNAVLLYPYVKAVDSRTRPTDRPYGPFMAGVIAATDAQFGVQRSPSNVELNGVKGTVLPISGGYGSAGSDANVLNEVGVNTVLVTNGRGIRAWGNRNGSSTPVQPNTEADVFISVQRVKHYVKATIQLTMIDYLDREINRGLIDAIVETGSALLRGMGSEGILVGGTMRYVPEQNTEAAISAGILEFEVEIFGPTPAENLRFGITLNPDFLENLAA